MQDYRKLEIWSLAKEVAVEVYKMTEIFPKEEIFGITSQLRRAIISVSSNISEGAGRETPKEFKYFINVAIGSLFEVSSLVDVSYDLKFISSEISTDITESVEKLRRKTINFRKTL